MELLLIVVLGIVLVVLWNTSRNTTERIRETVARLDHEIEFLRSQVAGLVRAAAKVEEARQAETAAAATMQSQVDEKRVEQAAHAVPPPVAPFTAPAEAVEQHSAKAPFVPPPQRLEPVQPVAAPVPSRVSQPAAASRQQQTPRPAANLFSLEETLGANWLNKLGIGILVIGLAFFLAYKLQTWGPGGKILCGYAVSVLLLGGGVLLERKPTYRIFGRGGIGGGWALAYFTTFAAYHLQAARVLDSLPVDLVLMMLVAAGMVGHSLLYRSQTVTSLAFLLGFATLLTSHVEHPSETVIFSLAASAILAVALVVVTTIRHWAMLELCGLVAVYVSHFVWLNEVLPPDHASFPEFWPSTVLILLYWVIFRLAYVLRTPLDKREENLSSISAILNSGGVLGLLKFQSAHPEWAFWTLLVIGAIEMALAWWAKSKRRQAFVVLSTIAVVLLVSSVPFRFHGVSWPVLWLVQAQVLAIAGLRLGEPLFRRLGLLVGLITGAVLGLHDVMPLAIERFVSNDVEHHWSLAAGLALAAILYWTHSEVYPRRWPEIAANDLESLALKICSWLALGAAATCLWVMLPVQWVPVAWLGLVLVLGFAADWIEVARLGFEADLLAVVSLFGLALWDFDHSDWNHRWPMLLSAALLYCGMRRKKVAGSLNYVPAGYSWAAAILLITLTFNIFQDQWIAPVLAALCIVLFELGRFFRKGFFRWQGYTSLSLAFGVYLLTELAHASFGFVSSSSRFTFVDSNLLEVLILMFAGYWLLERTRSFDVVAKTEHALGIVADVAGTLCLIVWLAIRFPLYVSGGEGWLAVVWAAMATVLLTLAMVTRRRVFVIQAISIALLAVLRGTLIDLVSAHFSDFWHSELYHITIAGLVLLAALPFAFKLRGREFWEGASFAVPEPFAGALRHPEQWFFFAPLGMMIVALAVKLSSGHITIAWSLLGLGTFLFALVVGERSFRLAGLALLLVSVAKILLMDVWQLAPSDRYTTLIILGLALLAVSFLYTRFGATIRKYL